MAGHSEDQIHARPIQYMCQIAKLCHVKEFYPAVKPAETPTCCGQPMYCLG